MSSPTPQVQSPTSPSPDFVVSARKYRPQTFRSVVGQSHITETLVGAISRGQLAHAYLFTGPRGVGKTTCARIFARSINCLNPNSDFEPCGVCESCVSFAKDRSFNIHEMDAASNNSVEDIRALNEKVRVAPQVGKYSVYIIDEVHMLSTAAFNAFLKTLEEPPAHAIFILATTEKHKILPTILSRCQCYDFNRIRIEDTVEYLRYICKSEGVTSDDESLHIIAQKADGGMRDALSTFDMVVSFCGNALTYDRVAQSVGALDFDTFFSATDMALSGDYGSLVMLFDNTLSKGFEGQHFISGLAEHFRSLLVAKNPQTLPLLEASGNLLKRYADQANKADVSFLFGGINLLNTTDGTFRTATNRRLHAELALMKLCGLKGTPPERAVLPRVEFSGAGATTVAAAPSPAQNQAPVPAPAPVATPPVVEPTRDPLPVTQVSPPTPTPAPVPTPAPTPKGGSVLGFSINNQATQTTNNQPETATNRPEAAQPKTEAEIAQILGENVEKLIGLWNSRNRLRIATALSSHRVDGAKLVLLVSGEALQSELEMAKQDIERDILDIMGVRATLAVEIVDEVSVSRPVTVDQRLQHLVDINPDIITLRDKLDLTI